MFVHIEDDDDDDDDDTVGSIVNAETINLYFQRQRVRLKVT